MTLTYYLKNSLMPAMVNNLMFDICWVHLFLCSEISTVHLCHIQHALSSSIMTTGMIKHRHEIINVMEILKDVGEVLKL